MPNQSTQNPPAPTSGGGRRRFVPMFAKFNGKCETCAGRVATGSRGVYDTKSKRFHHFACAVDAGHVEADQTPEKAADARRERNYAIVEPDEFRNFSNGFQTDAEIEANHFGEPDWNELMAERGES